MNNGKKKSDEDLRKENEAMKARIAKEFGGMAGGSSDIPPDLENQFLKNVLAFEEQFEQGEETTVYDRIGRPKWVPADNLDEEGIEKELDRVQTLLHKNSITLDTICEVEHRVLYRFITEELFNVTTMNISVPGMISGFIYEEFHPNNEYDAKEAVTEFITHKLLRKEDTEDWFFNEDLKMRLGQNIDKETVIRRVKNFVNSWSEFNIHHFNLTSVELTGDDQSAVITFDVSYDATVADTSEVIKYEGNGRIRLESVYQRLGCAGWEVLVCDMPGFKLME